MKSEPMKWPPNADEKKENFVVIEWGGQLQEPVEGQEGGSRAQSGADAGPSQSRWVSRVDATSGNDSNDC